VIQFCERQDQSADYVRQTAEWVKKEFPGSAAQMLPKLRKIYARKRGHQAATS
jgi:hypothetical protein